MDVDMIFGALRHEFHHLTYIIANSRSSAQLLLCVRWELQKGGAPKQRPAFAVREVGAAEGRSPEAAPSFCRA